MYSRTFTYTSYLPPSKKENNYLLAISYYPTINTQNIILLFHIIAYDINNNTCKVIPLSINR